jgi:hypothetical protein
MSKKQNQEDELEQVLRKKNIRIETDDADIKNLNCSKPVLYIANEALEDTSLFVLSQLFQKQERPVKIITSRKNLPSYLTGCCIQVDFKLLLWEDYIKSVFKILKKASDKGYSYCLCWQFSENTLDAPFRDRFLNRLMKAILKAKLPVIPIRIKTPFPDFVPSILSSTLAMAPRKEPILIKVRVGNSVTLEDQENFTKPSDFRRFIQARIFTLGSGLEVKPFFLTKLLQIADSQTPIVEPFDPVLIAQEISNLKPDRYLASQAEFDIFVVKSKDIPYTLQEIGRRREITFRAVGEGTGKAIDIDEYDLYYRHLILWDREAQQLAGGYRMGLGDEIFSHYGIKGFYISSMFKIKEGLFPILEQAIEMGRSYIIPSYQKKRLPLYLLWKGVLYFLLKNPNYRYLYGPVSISKYYSNLSQSLIVAFIKKHYFNNELSAFLTPRKPFIAKVDKLDIETLTGNLEPQLSQLDNLIEDIESDRVKVPVLIRQYIKLNGRFISFNVDPNFSDSLDGFILVDLTKVPPEMIETLKKESL